MHAWKSYSSPFRVPFPVSAPSGASLSYRCHGRNHSHASNSNQGTVAVSVPRNDASVPSVGLFSGAATFAALLVNVRKTAITRGGGKFRNLFLAEVLGLSDNALPLEPGDYFHILKVNILSYRVNCALRRVFRSLLSTMIKLRGGQ